MKENQDKVRHICLEGTTMFGKAQVICRLFKKLNKYIYYTLKIFNFLLHCLYHGIIVFRCKEFLCLKQ